MKTFHFDTTGALTVKEITNELNADGVSEEKTETRSIEPDQLKAHLVMFADEMSAGELAQAQAIIDRL